VRERRKEESEGEKERERIFHHSLSLLSLLSLRFAPPLLPLSPFSPFSPSLPSFRLQTKREKRGTLFSSPCPCLNQIIFFWFSPPFDRVSIGGPGTPLPGASASPDPLVSWKWPADTNVTQQQLYNVTATSIVAKPEAAFDGLNSLVGAFEDALFWSRGVTPT
jgi:hypothetical protein